MDKSNLNLALKALAEIGHPAIARDIARKAKLETKQVAALLTRVPGVSYSMYRETGDFGSRCMKEYFLEEWENVK